MKLYDVYDGSKYIGELTLTEISELTGKTRSQISQAISGAYDINGRYVAIYDGQQTIAYSNKNDRRMLMEFDILTQNIRRAVSGKTKKERRSNTMNKMREYERGREDGLDLARRIVRQGGIEALEQECKFRGATGIHTSLAVKDLDKASEKIKEVIADSFVILSIAVLHDDFGFGEKRCQRFRNGLDRAADYINDGLAEWIDYVNAIKEELGIVLKNPGE